MVIINIDHICHPIHFAYYKKNTNDLCVYIRVYFFFNGFTKDIFYEKKTITTNNFNKIDALTY